jgi:hypothetical protein
MTRVLALDFGITLSVDEEHSIHLTILVMWEPFKGHRFLEKKVKCALTCEVLTLSSCLPCLWNSCRESFGIKR